MENDMFLKQGEDLSPICFFVYSRLRETQKSIEALQRNFLSSKSTLFVFSDGAKNEINEKEVRQVRRYIRSVKGFSAVEIYESDTNKGLADSIISGVSEIIDKYGKVIVLEDDLITSRNFLDYMNQALNFYATRKKIFAISGFSYPLKYPTDWRFDAALGLRSYSWGWASWKDRWREVDWNLADYDDFRRNSKLKKDFGRGGSDLLKMLERQMAGKIDSWMIRWVYHQFRNELIDVFPTVSKVSNIGFGDSSTHNRGSGLRYRTKIDDSDKRSFVFPEENDFNSEIAAQFGKKISPRRRFIYKLLDELGIGRYVMRRFYK